MSDPLDSTNATFDVVPQLRDITARILARKNMFHDTEVAGACKMAADEIERLRAERERYLALLNADSSCAVNEDTDLCAWSAKYTSACTRETGIPEVDVCENIAVVGTFDGMRGFCWEHRAEVETRG